MKLQEKKKKKKEETKVKLTAEAISKISSAVWIESGEVWDLIFTSKSAVFIFNTTRLPCILDMFGERKNEKQIMNKIKKCK